MFICIYREKAATWWNSKQHPNWTALKEIPQKLNILTNMELRIKKPGVNLNKRVNVSVSWVVWNHFIGYFIDFRCFIFTQLMKIKLNWTLFKLFFEDLWRSFCLFCKVNKTKNTCGLPCFLIEFMVSIEKLGCAWKSFELW